jgi:hypothetical protein
MVIARVFGGLGNQLFIYAAARSLALRRGSDLVLDTVSGFKEDTLFHRRFLLDRFNVSYKDAGSSDILLRPTMIGRVSRAIARRANRALPPKSRFYIADDMRRADRGILQGSQRAHVYLEGYWQSEECFRDHEATIRSELTPRHKPDKKTRSLAAEMACCDSVSVHFRTLVGSGNDTRPMARLSQTYYQSCFRELKERLANPHLYCFADSGVGLERILPEGMPTTVISHPNPDDCACEDLWLMTQCKHHVIANSTFSWWGAWLGRSSGQIVMAPDIESSGYTALLPREWSRRSVG